jgi:hypothetical protein
MRLVARAGILLAVCLVPGTAALAGGTLVETVRPFAGARLASGWSVSRVASGHCWTTSLAVSRPDAFRCFRGRFILDPCFASPTQKAWVACVQQPWTHEALRLNLSAPLPAPQLRSHAARAPWAVQVGGGAACTADSGALGVVQGRVPRYSCSNGASLAVKIHQVAPRWWVWYLPRGGSWQRRVVTRAWF